jgi:transposase
VVIGDGAEWIWNLAQQHFPVAIQIVDLYHARQHLWGLARQLYPQNEKRRNAWIGLHQKCWLDKGKIERLVDALRSLPTSDAELG